MAPELVMAWSTCKVNLINAVGARENLVPSRLERGAVSTVASSDLDLQLLVTRVLVHHLVA